MKMFFLYPGQTLHHLLPNKAFPWLRRLVRWQTNRKIQSKVILSFLIIYFNEEKINSILKFLVMLQKT